MKWEAFSLIVLTGLIYFHIFVHLNYMLIYQNILGTS